MALVLGDDMRDQFQTGEASLSDLDRALFLQAAEASTKLQNDGSPDRIVLYLGDGEWPFPAPLIKEGATWRFDGKEGKQEILDRRIGRNEMHAVETCLGYVEAQLDYARTDHDANGILEFAQRMVSSPGKQDGLYWESSSGTGSPLGPALAQVATDTSAATNARPGVWHHGYHFRILTAQGSNAPGGAHSFLIDGHLLGGFGLVAWPRQYGVTGIQTFVVNQFGTVYEKDLGAATPTAAPAIKAFDPDSTWKRLN
jgi:hypothetical protein